MQQRLIHFPYRYPTKWIVQEYAQLTCELIQNLQPNLQHVDLRAIFVHYRSGVLKFGQSRIYCV